MITDKEPVPHNDNSRIGFVFFFFYVAIYCAFVFLNAFFPEKMATVTFTGVNLPVIY
ncbi:MAG: hypothetical protein RIR17_1079, partial [Planctomycetota bacterium]